MKRRDKKTNIMNNMHKTRKNNGVSIMELLTVLAIIVTLVGVTLVEFGRMDDKAVRAGSLISLKGVAMALKMYKMDKRAYTCSYTDLYPYANMTSLKRSFILTPTIATDDCTFQAYTYLRLTALVNGITPAYTVRYNLVPAGEPECSTDNGTTYYSCGQKW